MAPSHYLNQYWLIITVNPLIKAIMKVFSSKINLNIFFSKWQIFCLGQRELTHYHCSNLFERESCHPDKIQNVAILCIFWSNSWCRVTIRSIISLKIRRNKSVEVPLSSPQADASIIEGCWTLKCGYLKIRALVLLLKTSNNTCG